MDRFSRLSLLLIVALFLSSCSTNEPKVNVTRAYYYWRTSDPSFAERKFLKTRGVKKLYTHLMDVDWSAVYGPIPVASHDLKRMNFHFSYYDSLNAGRIMRIIFIG
jgi:hypothetical protein